MMHMGKMAAVVAVAGLIVLHGQTIQVRGVVQEAGTNAPIANAQVQLVAPGQTGPRAAGTTGTDHSC